MRLSNFKISRQIGSLPLEARWFAMKTIHFMYHEMRVNKEAIEAVKAFYNHQSRSCIIRLKINQEYVIDDSGEFLYFMIDFNSKETSCYGIDLEKVISDKNNSITWIQKNEVLVFYPDNKIMDELVRRL